MYQRFLDMAFYRNMLIVFVGLIGNKGDRLYFYAFKCFLAVINNAVDIGCDKLLSGYLKLGGVNYTFGNNQSHGFTERQSLINKK